MVSSNYLRFALFTAVLCFAVRPTLVFSDGSEGCTNDGTQTTGGVTNDGDAPLPPMGPGGGAGGTIGSLPTVISSGNSGNGGGLLLMSNGSTFTTVVTISPGVKAGTPAAFGWIANGSTILSGTMSAATPSLTFYASDLKSAQQNYKSLVLIFVSSAGTVTSAVDIMKMAI